MNFKDKKCPICNLEFKINDDIVVCPDCGTPYHRDCFAKVLKCVNQDKHNLKENELDEGNKDTSDQNDNFSQGSTGENEQGNICKSCKTVNPKECIFCEVCGKSLYSETSQKNEDNINQNNNFKSVNNFFGSKPNPFDNPYGKFNANDTIAGETATDLTLFVGPNSGYFLDKFKIMDTNKKPTFNWAAAIFGPLYLAYRKSYVWAISFFLLLKLFEIITYLIQINFIKSTGTFNPYDLPYNTLIFLSSFVIIELILRVMCGLFFNKLYMKKAVKKINKHKNSKENGLKYSCELTKAGTVTFKLVLIFLIINILISLIVQSLSIFYLN